jgi:hypothetical protein
MLPLIPMAISMTLLMGATLFVVSPSDERHATATLADDMLRYHQAVNRAVADAVGPLDPGLDTLQSGLHFAPFKPLFGWDSAIAQEVDSSGGVIATWVVTWPADWEDSRPRQKADLASIPGRLRAAGYRNSRFGTWSVANATGVVPEGRLDGLRLSGVDIPVGAPVIANPARLPSPP